MAKTGEKKTDPHKKNGKPTPPAEMLANKEPDLNELLPVARVDLMNIQELLKTGRFELSGDDAMEMSRMRIRLSKILGPKQAVPKVEPVKPPKRK